MSEKKAYLKINPPVLGPDALDADAAREYLKTHVGYQKLADLIKDAQEMGGGFYKGWSQGLGLIPDNQPSEGGQGNYS